MAVKWERVAWKSEVLTPAEIAALYATLGHNHDSDYAPIAHAHTDYVASSLLTTRGDIIRRGATAPERYGLVAPSAPTINFLGVSNGETDPTWKSASSAGGADAHIVQTDASGYAQVARLGLGVSPAFSVHINSDDFVSVFRVANHTRYRSDFTMDSNGNGALNSYDDTALTHMPLRLDGKPLLLSHYSGGKVGINRSDASYQLDVNGDGRFTTGLIVNDAGGSAATDDFRAESDTEANMLWLDASADLLYLGGSTNGVSIAKGGALTTTSYMEYAEISDPDAPGSNKGRLYTRDNGSGKTQLCVRFASGAVQVIATEP